MFHAESKPASEKPARLFVCIRLTNSVRRTLTEIQVRLRSPGDRIAWVDPENMHLTLVFLGTCPAVLVPRLIHALDDAVQDLPPFALTINRLGWFGGRRRPSVIWAGPDDVPPGLLATHARVAEVCYDPEIPIDARPFHAHITLGRIRTPARAKNIVSRIESFPHPLQADTLKTDRICLMKSDLSPSGPRYTALHESRLTGRRKTEIKTERPGE